MVRIWADINERTLFLLVLADLIFVILIEIGFSVPFFLVGTAFEEFLTSESTKSLVSRLLVGLLSAYIFYLLINYIPRVGREKKTYKVLNSLIASVLDAYKRSRVFGHETAINAIDTTVLNSDWISETIKNIRNNATYFFQLKFAMETAHSRIEDFRHSLPLAVTLTPEHVEIWLVLTDKIRLLAENYGNQPEIPIEKRHLVDEETDENPVLLYRGDLRMRFLEILEQADQWLKLNPYKNG